MKVRFRQGVISMVLMCSLSAMYADTAAPLLSVLQGNNAPQAATATVADSGQPQPQGQGNAAMPMPTGTPQASVAVPNLSDQSISDQAFADMVRNLMPLTPEQIKTLKRLYSASRKAAAEPAGIPPKPTSSSIQVSLAPGSTPPVIRLAQGFVSSLVFLDSTGASWPIAAYDLGDPKSFNVSFDGQGNTLLIQALSEYKAGNLAVMLKGQNTPVMVTLMPGQNAVDYRADLRIPGLGPNAQLTSTGLPATESPQLLNFLDGVPPQGAQQMQVDGGAADAWIYNNRLYLRTRLTIISPGFMATINSADGMHAFEMPKSPIILASDHGKLIKLQVEGV